LAGEGNKEFKVRNNVQKNCRFSWWKIGRLFGGTFMWIRPSLEIPRKAGYDGVSVNPIKLNMIMQSTEIVALVKRA
jgi:hypothetical protein